MKFAKELERDAVPEWRIKYLNYKAGKKHIKAVGRAYSRAGATPRSLGNGTSSYFKARTPRSSRLNPNSRNDDPSKPSRQERSPGVPIPAVQPVPIAKHTELRPLNDDQGDLHYGSFVPTPPHPSSALVPVDSRDFELPDPAIPPPAGEITPPNLAKHFDFPNQIQRSVSLAEVPTTFKGASNTNSSPPIHKRPSVRESPSQLKRLFSYSTHLSRDGSQGAAIGLEPFNLVRERERELYEFLDSELEKVESFYKLKEEQAGQRLQVLKRQLHEMRNRRIQEMSLSRLRDSRNTEEESPENGDNFTLQSQGWFQPVKARIFTPGPNSRALQNMPRTPLLRGQNDSRRDYVRRPEDGEVSYRTAKRKLKLALQEFYRGLELLKSYALLNRVAFRKLNKKFDKAVNARPPYRYMNEKVNKSWFVDSDILDGHISAVEDLYARYFERGNHKLAAGKLRSLSKKPKDESGSSFLSGLLLGTGLVFAIQGTVNGARLLFGEDRELATNTSYLMQIYGGYFLCIVIFALFCLNCMIWTRNKVNYPFIFEFDMRHHLDWRRLAEFPALFFFIFGIFIWTNFSRYGPDGLYLYFPVMLIGITALLILMPAPILAHKSRRWFAYSHLRLLLAGIYPVEFRDFFLGDIYCSLTYTTSNIELFFCLYGHGWQNPAQCNSNHSRAMGFLAALPPIWRFLQCIRRYKDTGNVFPHLVNCGKYSMTILSAITLSVYRIQNSSSHLALFIAMSSINSIYCSIWDLFMDFSLLQSHSRHLFLRDILALKSLWPYYFIMIVDPILRFAWIFYAIFTHNAQHSTIVSFLVSFTEVIRRGMWILFRVENEHCSNVSQYKASRDVPLPYHIEPLVGRLSSESTSPTWVPREGSRPSQTVVHVDPESLMSGSSTAVASAGASTNVLRRRTDGSSGGLAQALSKILAEAHKQDFVKRKPISQDAQEEDARAGHLSDGDDESPSDRDDDAGSEEEDELQNEAETTAANELRISGQN